MATTINAQNALQIREKPMEVYITLQAGSSAKISNYAPSGTYKSYDSTLGNSSYTMRNIADLAGEGFPLDGSYRLYDPNEATDATNGKLGLRGNAGQDVAVTITASATLTAVTVATRGVGTITVGGTSYPSTGNNVIPINARTATLTFTPAVNNGRAEVDYIVPGITLSATNDMLTRCTLALRSNLNVIDHSWEESEIEFEMYYPYDISSSFSYVQNEWPITYRAGYDGDLSAERKFYLSEPVEMKDNIITIKGVDASHWLDEFTMNEQWIETNRGEAHQTVYSLFMKAIDNAGIRLEKSVKWSGTKTSTYDTAVVPEMTARDFVAGVMNLTLSDKYNGTNYGIQFVDAGIPAVEYGDGTTFGNTWAIFKSDCADWVETYEQNISSIKDSNGEHNFAERMVQGGAGTGKVLFGTIETNTIPPSTNDKGNYNATRTGEVVELSYDGYFSDFNIDGITPIKNTPTSFYGIINRNSSLVTNQPSGGIPPAYQYTAVNFARIIGRPATISGGVKSYSNPNHLPGITVQFEPFILGNILDINGRAVFNYQSLFNRSIHKGSFTWKGDPRMQPLDYIVIVNDTNDGRDTITARITSIELTHEGGGTTATISWREWEMELSGTVLADENGAVLIDNNGDFISA